MQSFARSLARSLALAALPLLSFGCGESDDTPSSDPKSFIGTWSYTSGTLTATCTGVGPQTVTLAGNVTVTAGTAQDLIVADPYCTVTADVSGTTATATPSGQTCAISVPVATTTAMLMGTYSAFTFTTSDGKTGHISAALSGMGSAMGVSLPCTVTESAELTKQ